MCAKFFLATLLKKGPFFKNNFFAFVSFRNKYSLCKYFIVLCGEMAEIFTQKTPAKIA